MTQLLHELETAAFIAVRPRTGVVFVPCAICRKPVDLGAVNSANDAPICERHFVTELPADFARSLRQYR